MLSKKVCRNCAETHLLLNERRKEWNGYDEIRWEKGYVICGFCEPMIHSAANRMPIDIPLMAISSVCPYFLEHVMEAQNAEHENLPEMLAKPE